MYNKLIIFDLDGVLLDSKDLHFQSLNKSLAEIDQKYVIDYQEHLTIFDGLSTQKKLELLNQTRGLDLGLFKSIWRRKQQFTIEGLKKIVPDPKLQNIFKSLAVQGVKTAVASNSIRETVKLCLLKLGILEYVDYFVSNEDVSMPKPFPEMYWKCMTATNGIPHTTVIIEDSAVGQKGALHSGAHVIGVKNASHLTEDTILSATELLNNPVRVCWHDSLLNVVIPMAGLGSRFAKEGYALPKPLIDVNGKPMIQRVVENLKIKANFIFLLQQKDLQYYNLEPFLKAISPDCKIVVLQEHTEGAACTVLAAKKLIDNEKSLLIANSDQLINWDSFETMYQFCNSSSKGGILTFESQDPKWSYVKQDRFSRVIEVAEKVVISNQATVGIYFWKQGRDFVFFAEQMIHKNKRVNNEFYICPVYNEAIEQGWGFQAVPVKEMWGLGTPADLNHYLKEGPIL